VIKMTGEINEPKITLTREMNQVLADGPARTRLGVAPSVLMPTLQEQVRQAEKNWPSYMPASVAALRMPRMTPTPVMKPYPRLGLGSPGIWETLLGSFKKDWKWWLGGAIATVVVIAIVASGGGKE